MNNDIIGIITKLLNRLVFAGTYEDMETAIADGMAALSAENTDELRVALYRLRDRLLQVDEQYKDALRSRRIAQLSDTEKTEFEAVERILDGNLLNYHFQPIVNTANGEIFAYEALMRSADDPKITPFHILKYAELGDRLNEVEKATFLNVLNIIEQDKAQLKGRLVFINSIPNVVLDSADADQVFELLRRNSDTAVVELTEMAEADGAQLQILKDRYQSINVRIAVDDYGTGYSNVQNLLRYTPNVVKIDRSLLSGINTDRKKRHLVRDIIDFCHDNGIFALAEGVETSEELKAVMLLGADLIQGYYTGRPSPERIDAVSYEIKQEILQYHQQRMDGKESHIYKIEGADRVPLEKLVKHGYTTIRIMPPEEPGGITIVGDPSLTSEIQIEIDRGFEGRVTIDNVHLQNNKNRPCIKLAEGSRAELCIVNECSLSKGGIYVPEGAELEFAGSGILSISVSATDFFCIGAPKDERHGKLIFNADTEYSLSAHGDTGAYIGGGRGGEIVINHGVFSINGNINNAVGIGSIAGDTDISMRNCNIETDVTIAKGSVIGSCDGNASITLTGLSLKTIAGGMEVVCAGSVNGRASIAMENANFTADAGADNLTVLGSMYSASDISAKNMSMSIKAVGSRSYVFGGVNGMTKLRLFSTDTQIKLVTKFDYFVREEGSQIELGGGRYRVVINDTPIEIRPNV